MGSAANPRRRALESAADIRLVCFDLGRVLVRICDNWQHAGEVARLPMPLPKLPDPVRAQLTHAVIDSETGRISLDEFCARSGALFGIDPSHIRAVSDIYLLGCYDGVGELLGELTARGFQTACLSNTNENHWQIMFHTGGAAFAPLSRLQHRFGSQIIGCRKPDLRIYEHVERSVKLPGRNIVFFDDLQENVDAARARGWNAELILHDGNPVNQVRQHLSRLRVL
jgi:putative hydrolase of the HAD superfamily